MSAKIQSIRGMNDILPDQVSTWQYLEQHLRQLMRQYAYQEIRFPIVEQTDLFKRSIGEVTDIVEKEMYTFTDRNGDSLSLRPEGTAVCVRAAIQHGLLVNQQQRLWYCGPMFRHERPQKGRYRQFHQFGVEVFGLKGPDIDAELLLMLHRLWRNIGLSQEVRLQINSLGNIQSRQTYKKVLTDYLRAHQQRLDEDSQRRLHSNPLRILDSKNPDMREIIAGAPKLIDYLDAESQADFEQLCAYLSACQIDYEINPRLVRGLDYYNKLVFEWVTDSLGAQGTVCAGGRYDGLARQLHGRDTPAVGFAMGLERLVAMLQNNPAIHSAKPDAVMVVMGEKAREKVFGIVEAIRDKMPDFSLQTLCGGGSFKSQMKKADKSGAALALILADNEVAQNQISIKWLRDKEKAQQSLSLPGVIECLQDYHNR